MRDNNTDSQLVFNGERQMMTLNIGLFGAGIVGGGVIDLIQRSTDRYKMVGISISIAKVCIKNGNKQRDIALNSPGVYVSSYSDILNDESINCIVEVMGGVTDAKDVVFEAIRRGKHVITANKALVAAFLPEIQALLAANPTVRLILQLR